MYVLSINIEEEEQGEDMVIFQAEILVNFLNKTLEYYGYDRTVNFTTDWVADSGTTNHVTVILMVTIHLH